MDLDDLKFFNEGKQISDVLDEFGEVYGSKLFDELLEQGLIEEAPYGETYFLTGAGQRKIGKKIENERGALKIFLSYSSLDYEQAKNLKEFLEAFGMDVFLAHTSIEPSKTWEEEIYKSLKECDVFIPLLTNNFKNSKWTDQECGIAYNEGKKIIPLMIDLTPYGFLGKFQALRLDTSKWTWRDKDDRVKLIDFINTEFLSRMRESILNSLEKTTSWIIGKTKIRLFKFYEPFSMEEANKIIEASASNNQLYDAEGAKEYLSTLIRKYKINSESAESILNLIKEREAREILGGKTNAGQPVLYGTPEEKLKQLEGYGGETIEEIREELKKEIEKEKKFSLVKGTKDGL